MLIYLILTSNRQQMSLVKNAIQGLKENTTNNPLSLNDINSLNGSWKVYRSGPMQGKADNGFVLIEDAWDLTQYIDNILKPHFTKKVTPVYTERGIANGIEDKYEVIMQNGTTFVVFRQYDNVPMGNVSFYQKITVSNIKLNNA